ncbi:siderophore-interacting protein [Deinococcus radiophilus]|uniref:Siderophore-interacting protein n=1 Tax=Deinococcus radiophilus TaxID=32062 RepID=A0A431VS07_9DEIO|nr:siderophore-interacting protein [Deinococcus radiophilus]RTR26000.1 siderophore-interacting protein [Deinococcus radiophilus]UFA51843.1 siderophore-interacting protein [Deinococcus radiophilus]
MTTDTATRTPLTGEDITDIIEHVNEGHITELLYAVRAFSEIAAPGHAQITNLYADGAALDVVTDAGTTQVFVPFAVQAPPHEALQATVAEAMCRLGLKPEGRVAHWRLQSAQDVSPNMRRLVMDLCGDSRDDWRPGDACRFDIPGHEHGRPYTLRSVSDTQATVDVYCHGGSLGSRWAQALSAGDQITVRGGRHEPLPDFAQAAALLIGDETALPTIAALLETWPANQPLEVLLEVADPADQAYLDDVACPSQARITWLQRTETSGEAVAARLGMLTQPPAAVWGALEVQAAKAMRRQLTALFPATEVRISGYWRVDETH